MHGVYTNATQIACVFGPNLSNAYFARTSRRMGNSVAETSSAHFLIIQGPTGSLWYHAGTPSHALPKRHARYADTDQQMGAAIASWVHWVSSSFSTITQETNSNTGQTAQPNSKSKRELRLFHHPRPFTLSKLMPWPFEVRRKSSW